MYNRYFPAENGVFTCRSVPEPTPPSPVERSEPRRSGLLERLLPKGLDTGDLLLLLILLLVMQDSEDRESLLLTALAFLFL